MDCEGEIAAGAFEAEGSYFGESADAPAGSGEPCLLSKVSPGDGGAVKDKEFIIVKSKGGNYFYIVIDHEIGRAHV